VIFSLIMGFFLGCVGNYVFYRKSARDSSLNRYLSLQRSVPPALRGFPVLIADGTNVQRINKSGPFAPMISFNPFKFYVDKEGMIEIYGDIRNPDGALVVMVCKDQVTIMQDTGIDINSDSKGFEVVDNNGYPLFQLSVIPSKEWKEQKTGLSPTAPSEIDERTHKVLEKLEPGLGNMIGSQLIENNKRMQTETDAMLSGVNEVVQFYYVSCQGNTWWCVTPEGSQRVDTLASAQEWQRKIPLLFKYPGLKHPGVRLNDLRR
jgi:hypothetical protein